MATILNANGTNASAYITAGENKSTMAKVVPIDQVVANPPMMVRRARITLEKQGQIEPAEVIKINNHYHILDDADNIYQHDFWHAAKKLGWTTFLIVEILGEED